MRVWVLCVVGLVACGRTDRNGVREGDAAGALSQAGRAQGGRLQGSGGARAGAAVGGSAADGSGAVAGAGAPAECGVTAQRNLRLLSQDEYNLSVAQVLGPGPGRELQTFSVGAGEERNAPALAEMVELGARRAALTHVSQYGICPTSPGAECAGEFARVLGKQLYRRELLAAEVAEYSELFVQTGDLVAVLEALLLSPFFVYEVALAADTAQAVGAPSALTSAELAARLALFLWARPPNDTLRAAVASASTEAEYTAMVTDMMREPRFADGAASLADRWLGLFTYATTELADERGVSISLMADAREETRRFVSAVLSGPEPTVTELLGAEYSFLTPQLAEQYGMAGGDEIFSRTALPAGERAGLLSQVGRLVWAPSIASRGSWAVRDLLCRQIPVPPADLLDGVDRTPEQYRKDMGELPCWGCHASFGPVGFGFTQYDAIGRYRTHHADGTPVNARGTLSGTDVDGEFDGVQGLARRLAQSQMVSTCFWASWLGVALGTERESSDGCDAIAGPAGTDLRTLLVSVVSSPQFRSVPKAAPWAPPTGARSAREHAALEALSLAEVLPNPKDQALMELYAERLSGSPSR